MFLLIALVFIIGYVLIAIEHSIKIDKAALALFTGVTCWVLLTVGRSSFPMLGSGMEVIDAAVLHHLAEIAEILFFLMGAMTIVELIDSHNGFEKVTAKITTKNRIKLLWIICFTTFFFSAILDNLTTAIVMAALLKKLIKQKEDLWFFAGMVIIAANAGGAWSPIGDVPSIMLWIGGQISAVHIITKTFLPSLICLLIPLLLVSFQQRKAIERPIFSDATQLKVSKKESNLILVLGVLGLLAVPVFKNLTHLPPFLGMLVSLSILWIVVEVIHRNKSPEHAGDLRVSSIIRKIDTPSVLFFLGILLAVASLQTAGHLQELAHFLDQKFNNLYAVNVSIGLLSSIVDNVPLVAGAMGMYPLTVYGQDHVFWELLAYCAGTGGSVLIIGSAAGVAIMGIMKIDFMWYLKRVSWLALVGYLSGVLTHYLFQL